ncbi:DNA polymerase III subunit delta' [Oceanimonas sp. GK1]|uniref:DNA polymerase III subunit delta' n=1 Tax=Oceanimonas sp. (strain GK1 / IBRC-M 10197) TaxID=511062 RepID=UPI0002494F97|nr:DNA polymerase III subunit delta' [Oceanimonas sp. GK1]AEY01735.1 DNA polymerase III subunit delta' [Oceanimonas sp. GK1]
MYGWLTPVWQPLLQGVRERRLGHGLLLKGMAGLGKRELAGKLATALLCQHTSNAPCGMCHACELNAAGSHSDLQVVGREGRSIGIDAIRELSRIMSESARLGHGKVAIIERAELMTEAAANALLKTLEEPAGEATLILVSSQPERLLPTLISRCQQWLVPLPDTQLALAWLKEQGVAATAAALSVNQGSPLQTLDYLNTGADDKRLQLLTALVSLGEAPTQLPMVQAGLLEQPVHLVWVQLLLQDALQTALGVRASLKLDDCRRLSARLARLGFMTLHELNNELLALRRRLQPGQGRPMNAGLQLSQWLRRLQQTLTHE